MPDPGGDAVEISEMERGILEILKDPRHSPADAARFLKITRPAVTYHLNNLKRKGLVKKLRGVKGAGSYTVTTDGLRHIFKRLEDFDDDHQGCLIISPTEREVHHWDAMFQVNTPFYSRYPWSRSSLPPNDFYWWKDDFKEMIDDEEIHVPTIRFIDGKDKKSITFFFEHEMVDSETTYQDVEDKYLRWAMKLGAWFQKKYGPDLSLIKWSGAPHYVLGMSPEVALILMEAGIRTEYVHADASPRIGQPHAETSNLEYALLDATAPHHIKNLYAKENQTQVMLYKLLDRTQTIETNGTHYDHIINSLLDYIQTLATSVDRIADARLKEELNTEQMVTEVMERLQNGNGKKKPSTDPGDMFG